MASGAKLVINIGDALGCRLVVEEEQNFHFWIDSLLLDSSVEARSCLRFVSDSYTKSEKPTETS